MSNKERDILVTHDLDGVYYVAPPPRDTFWSLFLKGNVPIPPRGVALDEQNGNYTFWSDLRDVGDAVLHAFKRTYPNAIKAAPTFRQFAQDSQRNISMAILSGRKSHLHEVTIYSLEKQGILGYFDFVHLNTGQSSSGFKEQKVREYALKGFNVVHIDDDLKAGLRIARVSEELPEDQKVLVYLIKNLSNHPLLLRRAGLKLPENIVPINNLKAILGDLEQRLLQKEI
jgi:hypothetical protein